MLIYHKYEGIGVSNQERGVNRDIRKTSLFGTLVTLLFHTHQSTRQLVNATLIQQI